MKKIKGFTLIELMIVLAILGILAAVAIPAYQDYIDGGAGGSRRKLPAHTACVAGYLFASNGQQIIGAAGGGIPCGDAAQNASGPSPK